MLYIDMTKMSQEELYYGMKSVVLRSEVMEEMVILAEYEQI